MAKALSATTSKHVPVVAPKASPPPCATIPLPERAGSLSGQSCDGDFDQAVRDWNDVARGGRSPGPVTAEGTRVAIGPVTSIPLPEVTAPDVLAEGTRVAIGPVTSIPLPEVATPVEDPTGIEFA